MKAPLRAAVFASGSGSNFQALLDREVEGGASWETVLLVADRDSAGALGRAEGHGVATCVVPFRQRTSEEIDADLSECLAQAKVDVIFLAGFLRLIPPGVIHRYRNRILNIHPGLLPAFGGQGMWGMKVHRAVLESGARISGPTVHLVDEIYDRGQILAQWPVPVMPGDTPESLAARVLAVEHRVYPEVAEHLCRALREDRTVDPLAPRTESFGSDSAGALFKSIESLSRES